MTDDERAFEYADVWVDDFPQEAIEHYGLDEDGAE